MRQVLIIVAAIALIATQGEAADFYASSYSKAASWKEAAAHERVQLLLQEDGVRIIMDGEIKDGDFAQLTAIHTLVPVHTLVVSSAGGSVAEAIKFIEFVEKYGVEVSTLGCRRDPEECICASACAFIWLAAPVRSGHRIKVHRPYFRGGDFASGADVEAMKGYNKAASQIRAMLVAKGHPQDFINKMFNTPREQARSLTPEEYQTLPIDVALDELLSARCYNGKQDDLSRRHALYEAASAAEKEADAIRVELPDKPGYELEANPLYRKEYRTWLALSKNVEVLRKQASAFDKIASDFRSCKYNEQRRVSLRKSGGERLTKEHRTLLRRFAEVLKSPDSIAVEAFIAKNLPDHEFGQQAQAEMLERQRELPVLLEEMRSALPGPHFEYIMAALPQSVRRTPTRNFSNPQLRRPDDQTQKSNP